MTAIYALQGRVRRTELDHLSIGLCLALEPPLFHRPRGLGRPMFVSRTYTLARYDPASKTGVYLAHREYWMD